MTGVEVAGRVLYAGERTQVTRVRRPDGSWVIRKSALGPGGTRRLRHEVELLRRLAGVAGVPRLLFPGACRSPA